MKPLVSILIPLYNAEKFIAETIKSALNQTWENKEIIIVDDGSTDNSLHIAKSFESTIVKVYPQENSGSCVTRNNAFKYSNGDFIQYLDADDLLSPFKIEHQMNILERLGNSICSCSWYNFSLNLEDVEYRTEKVWKDYENPINWLVDAWTGGGMMQTACWLTPRKLIEMSGGWNASLKKNPNDDGEFFSRVLLLSESIKFVADSKVYYRKSTTANVSRQKNIVAIDSLLESYKQYEINILKKEDSEIIRKAIAENYIYFIYKYDRIFPELCKKSEEYFHNLGFNKIWPVGKGYFRKTANLIGFKNALFIRKIFRSNPIVE